VSSELCIIFPPLFTKVLMESLTSPKKSSKPSLSELWKESSRARLKNPWDLRKGKGERGECRCDEEGRQRQLINFFSLSNSLTRSVFTEFNCFRVFNPILHVIYELTRKIVRFYESTRDFDNIEYKHSYHKEKAHLTTINQALFTWP
jgi:hypothetical protein